jgi:hypothetical protein
MRVRMAQRAQAILVVVILAGVGLGWPSYATANGTSGVAPVPLSPSLATNELGGPAHNAFDPHGLPGPLQPLWHRMMPASTSWALESGGRVFAQSQHTLYALGAGDGSLLWAVDWGGSTPTDAADVVIDGNTLVTAGRPDGRLVAYDATTGRELWAISGPLGPDGLGPFRKVVAPGDGVVFVSNSYHDTIEARRVSTGALVWSADGPAETMTYADGKLFTNSRNCGMQARDPETGRQLWATSVPCYRSAVTPMTPPAAQSPAPGSAAARRTQRHRHRFGPGPTS